MSFSGNEDLSEQYARYLSLHLYQKKETYNFKVFSVKPKTMHNDGVIIYNNTEYFMKCFFIAISQALNTLGINVSPGYLANKYNMLNNDMIDTNIKNHKIIIENIAKTYDLKIEFFIGQSRKENNSTVWYTTPYPQITIGTGKSTIRLLNYGQHFELLLSVEQGFIPKFDQNKIATVLEEQYHSFAVQKATNDAIKRILEEEERQMQENIEREIKDRQYAISLMEKEKAILDDFELAKSLIEKDEMIMKDFEYAKYLLKNN